MRRAPAMPPALAPALLGGAACAAEAAIALRLLDGATPALPLVGAHLLVAAALAAAAVVPRDGAGRDATFLVFVLSVAFLGPLGAAGAAFAAAMRLAFALRARPFAEWYAGLFPPEPMDRVRALHRRVVLRGHGPGRRATVAPFADVVALGTLEEKQAALALMAVGFRPGFAPALRAALNDAEGAVRVQAAGAVARIEHGFLRRSLELEARLAARPRDLPALAEAAAHHEAMVASGLLDPGRARGAAEAAIGLFRRLLALDPVGPQAERSRAAAGELLLRLGRVAEAERLLAPAAAAGPHRAEFAPWLDSLFRQRRFVELREACVRARGGAAGLPERLAGALSLWRGDAVPGRGPRP